MLLGTIHVLLQDVLSSFVQVISVVKDATLSFSLKADNSLPRAHNYQYGKALVRINVNMEGWPMCVRAYRVGVG